MIHELDDFCLFMSIEAKLRQFTPIQRLLMGALLGLTALHALLFAPGWQPVPVSRLLTAALPLVVALCGLWRMSKVSARERPSWLWLSLALALWASGQIVEVLVSRSPAASNLTADPSEFFYILAAFPLLLAISSTAETESIASLFSLNLLQSLLAAGLTFVLLFRTPLPSQKASMEILYAVECGFLAIAATLRLVTWSTAEERRRVRMLCGVLWLYLPIELGMDYATLRWNLRAGTPLDLLWSVPFLFAGWRALTLPFDEPPEAAKRHRIRRKIFLLIESLCPLLITLGVFALAAMLVPRHPAIALAAMLLLLLIQGLHSGLIQLNYLLSQRQLLRQEEKLKETNLVLERLSWLDPLTGISNRRHFTTALDAEWKRATRRRAPLAILMIDVDYFKSVNDLHGHSYGDACLVRVANVLREELRGAADLLARFGGEEFILMLPETSSEDAAAVAERLRCATAQAAIVNRASHFHQRLTISIGVASSQPGSVMKPELLIDAADRALYDAKRRGRNRVSLWHAESEAEGTPASLHSRGVAAPHRT